MPDVNECDQDLHDCEQESHGGFSCGCGDGFTLNDDGKSCSDVNECDAYDGQGPCDYHNGICHDIPGSYGCRCKVGFEVKENLHACSDVDECLDNSGKGPCDDICIDMIGSYCFSCRDRNDLSADGFSCVAPSMQRGLWSTSARVCRPADSYSCDSEGQWHLLGRSTCDADDVPEDAPWPDCSRIRLAWMSQMTNQVDYYYDGDCQNNVADIIQMFDRLLNTLGAAATSESGTCNIENIRLRGVR
ncbi:GAS6 [Branchiostoma lanceolatum]|uniref:GAS6 protein n=1 Tax=Branchiostoma lanceolatum TaxID=7740 RepID=A0A8K0AH89_BRALA|nr:GAS6 [Branchiostoma lanceolatum]